MTGFVYFVKPVGQAGPIKVGHSSYPPARLRTLQTWSPVELELISSFEGSLATEKAVHERFAKWQVRGEWFDSVPELVALAEGVRDGKSVSDLIDLSVKTGILYRKPNTNNDMAKIVGGFKRRVDSAMRYASAVSGQRQGMSPEVEAILSTSGGYRQEYRALTDAEVETLEVFIAWCRDKGRLNARRRSAHPDAPVAVEVAA